MIIAMNQIKPDFLTYKLKKSEKFYFIYLKNK